MSVSAQVARASSKFWPLIFVLLCGVAGAVRFIGLSRFSFDGDEIFSLRIAGAPWSDVLGLITRDISHPPLFYLLLKLWISLGRGSEAWTRLLPAAFGWAGFIPLYGIGRMLRLRDLGLMLVLGLFTFNGTLIYYSQHLRMFSLLELTSILSLFVFTRIVGESAPSSRQFYGLAAMNVLLVYSHYWGWLVVFAELATLLALDRGKVGRFVATNVWVAVAFLPWAIAVAMAALGKGSVTNQISWIGQPDGTSLVWLLGDIDGAPGFPHATVLGILLFGLPILVLLYRLAIDRQLRQDFRVSPLCWVSLFAWPIVVTFAIGFLAGQSVWGERQLIIVFAPYFILVGIAASRLPWPRLALTAQLVLLLWSVAAGAAALADDHQKLEWRSIAEFIVSESGPGPAVPVYAPEEFVGAPLTFYFARVGATQFGVTIEPDPSKIAGDRFWFVYRNTKWKDAQSPEALFKARGFVVDKEVSTHTSSQAIIGLLLHRAR